MTTSAMNKTKFSIVQHTVCVLQNLNISSLTNTEPVIIISQHYVPHRHSYFCFAYGVLMTWQITAAAGNTIEMKSL